MINHNNLKTIEKLVNKIEYTVTDLKKEVRISQCEDTYFAYDMYKEDMINLYNEAQKNIIALINTNRDYSNIFIPRKSTQRQVQEYIDLSRIKGLTAKQKYLIQYAQIDKEHDDYLYIEYEEDPTKKQEEAIRKKILTSIIIEEVTARGYCQGDYETYIIAYYKDFNYTDYNPINQLVLNLKHLFTPTEFFVEVVHIETRLYTSGIEEVEEVRQEEECTGYISYSGYIKDAGIELEDYKNKGYTIIEK